MSLVVADFPVAARFQPISPVYRRNHANSEIFRGAASAWILFKSFRWFRSFLRAIRTALESILRIPTECLYIYETYTYETLWLLQEKKKPMNQIMANKYNGILNILGIRKKKKKKKEKKRKKRKEEEQNERIESSAIFCDIMELKYFVKIGRNWNSPQLRPRQGNLYCRNLCNSRGATRTSRCKLPSPGECRKVNGILSSAYAEKFYASVSAFMFAMLLHQS